MGTMSDELRLVDVLTRLVATIERCEVEGTKTSDSFVFGDAKSILKEVEQNHIQLMRELRRVYEAKEEQNRRRFHSFLSELIDLAEDDEHVLVGSEEDNDEQDQEGMRES